MVLFFALAFNTAFADDTKTDVVDAVAATTETAETNLEWEKLTNAELRREVRTTDADSVTNPAVKELMTQFNATCTNRFSSDCSDNLNRLRLAAK